MTEQEIQELIERAEREITELEEKLINLRIVLAIKKKHPNFKESRIDRILDRGEDDPYYGVPV